MGLELICPDCGGVIESDGAETRPRCTCSANLTMDDTEVELQPLPPPPTDPAPAVVTPRKICCQCGKDVTNAKRAKDASGYWCYECHRNALRKERGMDKPRARCPQCGRMVPAEAITTYHNNTMCTKCRLEQDELPKHLQLKYRPKLEGDPDAAKIEKRRIIILASVFGVLAIIIILGKLHLMPSLF
jgi:DNA-directed RNA polymerase subunit RPC12/RpoP